MTANFLLMELHGKVFQIDYTKDESQALLSESINARSVDVSYETRFLDPIPVSQVNSGFLGINLSRLIGSDGNQTVASMQNEMHAYAARTNGNTQDQFAFQTFIAEFTGKGPGGKQGKQDIAGTVELVKQ